MYSNIFVIITSLLTFSFLSGFAQRPEGTRSRSESTSPFYIQGQLINKSDEPIEFATVSIFTALDSILTTGGLTNEKGMFRIQVKPGKYYLVIQFMGYQPITISNIILEKSNPVYRTGKIIQKESEINLEEVVIQGERTQMELQLDKKVFHIGKDLSNLGGSASDMLDNLPSIQVDIEGNVSLRGSESVRILIDGKPSGLVGLSSNDALRQLNSNLIERVEVITNPSARYDAEGLAGIINIILKKKKAKGINGSFQINTGVPANHGASYNLNFRKKWINLFTNFGINYRRNPGYGSSYQEFGSPIVQITHRDRTHDRGGISYSFRLGTDLYLNDKNTLTLSFAYRFADEKNKTVLNYLDMYPKSIVDSLSIRKDDETEGDENLEYSLNYTKKFKKKGQKLTASIQYQNNNETEGSDLVQSIGVGDSDQIPFLYQRAGNDEIEERIMLQSDYQYPFRKDGKLEVGTRYTRRLVGNNYLVEDQDSNSIYQINTSFSNDFEYIEKVFATYAILSHKMDKISLQTGLRMESTELTTFQKTDNIKNTQNYINLFPSFFFTYNLTKVQAVQMSYSRRVRRPRGRHLNPFTSISDARNYFVGNPFLLPVFTHSVELGYLLNKESYSFYSGMYYRNSNGITRRITTTDQENISTTRPYNISKEDSYGLEANLSGDISKWFSLNGNINLFYSYIPAGFISYNDVIVNFNDTETLSLSSRLSNNFKIKKLFNAQININYRAPRNTVQGKRLSITFLDLGFSRDILKNKGTLSLSIRDLFNTRKYRGETFNSNSYQESEFQWRSRSVQLSFIYRLNQKKNNRNRNNNESENAEF